jgi:hypothetical protein
MPKKNIKNYQANQKYRHEQSTQILGYIALDIGDKHLNGTFLPLIDANSTGFEVCTLLMGEVCGCSNERQPPPHQGRMASTIGATLYAQFPSHPFDAGR